MVWTELDCDDAAEVLATNLLATNLLAANLKRSENYKLAGWSSTIS
jgi:hypothetical protein